MDIDKAWQPIHFLLCGDITEGHPSLGNVVRGGTPLGDVDVGYGPARYLTPDEVRAAAEALDAIPVYDLMERFDYGALIEAEAIFAHTDAKEDDWREYIRDHYQYLRLFFREAANSKEAMLLYIA